MPRLASKNSVAPELPRCQRDHLRQVLSRLLLNQDDDKRSEGDAGSIRKSRSMGVNQKDQSGTAPTTARTPTPSSPTNVGATVTMTTSSTFFGEVKKDEMTRDPPSIIRWVIDVLIRSRSGRRSKMPGDRAHVRGRR